MNEDAARLLEAAGDLIERYGWWQSGKRGTGDNGAGRCATIALLDADPDNDRAFLAAVDAACKEIGVEWPYSARALAIWNDAPERTKEEVIAALRNAKRFC